MRTYRFEYRGPYDRWNAYRKADIKAEKAVDARLAFDRLYPNAECVVVKSFLEPCLRFIEPTEGRFFMLLGFDCPWMSLSLLGSPIVVNTVDHQVTLS